MSSPAVSTPHSRVSSPATVLSASSPTRRSPAPSSTGPDGLQIRQLLTPAAPTLSHDARLVANREIEKAQTQLDSILNERRTMSEQSKKWHARLSESPTSFSQQVQASAARLAQLDVDQAETEALLQHRATLAVHTERALAAQASSSRAQQEFGRARQAAREVRHDAQTLSHTPAHTTIHGFTHPTALRVAGGRARGRGARGLGQGQGGGGVGQG